MKHNKSSQLAAALALGLFASAGSPALAQDVTPVVLANTCFSCHGTEGKSKGAMPSLAGKPSKFIEVALRQYREDKLPGTVMNRIAKGFSDNEIDALAHYFASMK